MTIGNCQQNELEDCVSCAGTFNVLLKFKLITESSYVLRATVYTITTCLTNISYATSSKLPNVRLISFPKNKTSIELGLTELKGTQGFTVSSF